MGADQRVVYAVPITRIGEHPGDRAAEWCWGTCGKGLIYGIELDGIGAAIPCATPAAECPHGAVDMAQAWGTGPQGERVHLRKLKEAAHGER